MLAAWQEVPRPDMLTSSNSDTYQKQKHRLETANWDKATPELYFATIDASVYLTPAGFHFLLPRLLKMVVAFQTKDERIDNVWSETLAMLSGSIGNDTILIMDSTQRCVVRDMLQQVSVTYYHGRLDGILTEAVEKLQAKTPEI